MKIQLLKVAAFALLQALTVHANGDDDAVYTSDDGPHLLQLYRQRLHPHHPYECHALLDEIEKLVNSSPGCRLLKALFDDEDIMGGTTQDVQDVSLSVLATLI